MGRKFNFVRLLTKTKISNFAGADIEIQVSSRKIKSMEDSPNNVLFRTHQYEFLIKPNEEFIKMCGDKKRGYFVDLKLFKKIDQFQGKFQEYNLLGLPVIAYTFSEDCQNNVWTCVLGLKEEFLIFSQIGWIQRKLPSKVIFVSKYQFIERLTMIPLKESFQKFLLLLLYFQSQVSI
jgi:hypothetical protein